MGVKLHVKTFRHPAISLWQSSLHHVLKQRSGEGLGDSASHALMRDADAAAHEHAEHHGLPRERREASECARLFTRLALAHFHGDTEQKAQLESEVRFLTCDPLWFEALVQYERALHLHSGEQFYRRHTRPDDFVLTLPDEATVALLADWGTGMPDARGLLRQVASFSPDVILHLGDIYYSGTPHEVRSHFLDLFEQVFGAHRPQLFALSGNHDRYSGGEGYRQLLEAIGQPASYFCLRNGYWQLIAMDTGLHDANPRALSHTMTRLETSEAAWLIDKIQRAERRGTVLFSHHPLFSHVSVGRDEQGRPLSTNPHLHGSLASILDDVSLWLWGHEHDLLLFEPYAGLKRGRCIGAGAVPLLVSERPKPVPELVPGPGEAEPPRTIDGVRLGNDGEVQNHAYAILRLEGPRLTVRYQQAESRLLSADEVPAAGPPLFQETITLSDA